MYLKDIKTMVRNNKLKRGLKPTPTYHWHKHWGSSGTDYLLIRYKMGVPSPLEKKLKIGGIIIQ